MAGRAGRAPKVAGEVAGEKSTSHSPPPPTPPAPLDALQSRQARQGRQGRQGRPINNKAELCSLVETRPSQGIKLTTTPTQDSHLTPPHILTSPPLTSPSH